MSDNNSKNSIDTLIRSYVNRLKKNVGQDGNYKLLRDKFKNIKAAKNIDEEKNVKYTASKKEQELCRKANENIESIKGSLWERYFWINFECEVNDKMVIGLGEPSVHEANITLHNIYGIPFIPAQAIKGTFRNYLEQEIGSLDNDKVKRIFGDETNQGKVIFLDAFPEQKYAIQDDIIAKHHADYYSDKCKFPLDTDKVDLVKFPVVKEAKFKITIGIERNIDIMKRECSYEFAYFLVKNLSDALELQGLGAKTSVGYGYFNVGRVELENTLRKDIEMLAKLEEKKKIDKLMKGMTELEKDIYYIEKINGKLEKNQAIMELFNQNIDILGDEERKKLAKYLMKYLKDNNKWKCGKKVNKDYKRIEKVCNVLEIDLPTEK
ncbi:type III-B CRISPR module RAMP protein Cmr6 [Clostridium oryzae]|uniref:CRISPR type III-associated protein domain-containing protein n=1 Tax=Clostridium oryzae TaxID=1450648 RepID=A0A1V4ISJ4_9CLOT|nr:type III-B CRISPR module RAMP protein Cmr6 [Clostridium oryzae]OPJ62774.1 hypothetical protein CLORY_16540 [Clostridium oryzae]